MTFHSHIELISNTFRMMGGKILLHSSKIATIMSIVLGPVDVCRIQFCLLYYFEQTSGTTSRILHLNTNNEWNGNAKSDHETQRTTDAIQHQFPFFLLKHNYFRTFSRDTKPTWLMLINKYQTVYSTFWLSENINA